MEQLRGQVVHCGRFGCVVKLEDGRFGILPASDRGLDDVRRVLASGRRPNFPFSVEQDDGRHVRLSLGTASTATSRPHFSQAEPAPEKFSSSLEQKIIDFWRQASEWDRNAGRLETDDIFNRPERLLPFEERAPRQYRDLPNKPRKGRKSTRRNRP
jgi:hypothetical protein